MLGWSRFSMNTDLILTFETEEAIFDSESVWSFCSLGIFSMLNLSKPPLTRSKYFTRVLS